MKADGREEQGPKAEGGVGLRGATDSNATFKRGPYNNIASICNKMPMNTCISQKQSIDNSISK